MTVTIAKPVQPIERGVWVEAGDFNQRCDSCGHIIIRYDQFLMFPRSHGSLCLECARPLKRGEVRR